MTVPNQPSDSLVNPSSDDRPRVPADIAKIVTDPFAYGDGRLFEAFKWLRENMPLGIIETTDFDPFWLVTKHADVRAISVRNDLFASGLSPIIPMDREGMQHMMAALGGRPEPARMLINMDLPDHPAYRALTDEQFRASSLDKMTADIREIARGFIDQLEATGGECDFARTVAFVYPLRVVMRMIGIPQEDEPYLLRLTQQMVAGHDPEHSRTGKALTGADAASQQIAVVDDFNAYFRKVIADRRANPRDDLATRLALATLDGEPIPELEQLSYYLILATAGHDTTASATLGGLIELARNPEEFSKVKEDPAMVKRFVEEANRWIAPAKITMRRALEDVEMCGCHFRKGDLIGLAWGSANFDEEVFEEPYVFKADRRPNKLMTFGAGPHVCLGQHLARLEMRILFEELLSRVDHVELIGPVLSVASFQISGPKSAPIRFRMSSARQPA